MCSHISDTPLYPSIHLFHHSISLCASGCMAYCSVLFVVFSQLMSLARNILPGLMHLAANCNFPIRDSISHLVALDLYSQSWSSCLISLSLLGGISIVIFCESKVVPRNSSLVVGGTTFSGDVCILRSLSREDRNLYAFSASSSSSALTKIIHVIKEKKAYLLHDPCDC